MKSKVFAFYLGLVITYFLLLFLGGTKHFQLLAVVSIAGNLLIWAVLGKVWEDQQPDSHAFRLLEEKKVQQLKRSEVLFIQFTLVFFSLANLYILNNVTDYSKVSDMLQFDFGTATFYTAIPLIIAAQFGGWFYQTILIYLFLEILGKEIKFSYLLKLTGIAYLGFLVAAAVIALINLFYLKNTFYQPEEVNALLFNSLPHIMIAKMGDFFTSLVIGIGLYKYTRFSFTKCMTAAFVPTMLLLLIVTVFNMFFNSASI